ncbi:heterokaryon incompatibility protein 6,OR allele [Podospora fimiseda]|uniref:Heterokaryon incompatibility protein 6,OR allele n=1 Tax=Podospora fimiseda TaxID=252190 RepID=A0AAN7BDD7_9PEZI|nr:heterokaryon incompatibility protein 6,OR allele [Podospora fimiseda]
MAQEKYQYRPLKDKTAIRLLTLDRGEFNNPLRGELSIVSIESAGNFEALSYVWAGSGLQDGTANEILLRNNNHGESLLILRGSSITAALRYLRLPDRSRRIWADQCCINQEDLAERSQQVQFMDRIYRDASHVLVWLGMDTDNQAESCFELVKKLDCLLGGGRAEDSDELETYIRENHKDLHALTDHAWFRRGWIVQEIGTTTPATMHWGNSQIEWEMLATICNRLKGYHRLRNALGISTSDISFLYRRFIPPDENTHHANRYNFIYELQRSRHLQFTDDRDRVFAFLGHFSTDLMHPLSCGRISITADYTKNVEQTYIDLAIKVLKENPTAAYILIASVQHPLSTLPSSTTKWETLPDWLKDKHRLPSWVPDWKRSNGIILAEPICPHHAHGNSLPHITTLETNNSFPILQLHGIEIDTIEACSQLLREDDFYRKKSSDHKITIVEQLWHDLCLKREFNLDDKYLPNDDDTAFYAFMQTLSNGCVQAAGHNSVPYQEVPDQVWLEKAARYILSTIGKDSGKISTDLQEVAMSAEDESDSDEWSRWATSASDSRIFGRTKNGYYVLGPATMEKGDVVCVLFGVKVPFCLRPLPGGERRYLLVGECYVHGLMKGEAMDGLVGKSVQERVFEVV